jgi:hypothetical protein
LAAIAMMIARPEVEAQVVRVDARDDEAVAQDAEEERADERAHHGARAAREQRAPMTAAGDPVEEDLVGSRGVGLDRARAHRLEHADEAGAVLQRMKLRMMTSRTFTPASAAPSRLPPTATVYRPQRVSVSTICSTMMIASAQISSE